MDAIAGMYCVHFLFYAFTNPISVIYRDRSPPANLKFKNSDWLEETAMAYNHRKAELEWLSWKEKEEKQLRELGVDEDTIQRLHTYDCQQFNKERQYQQRWQDEPNQIEKQIESEPSVYTVEALLDEIENMQLWEVLKKADKLTLEMLVMRMQGFSSRDISHSTGVPELAINNRIARLRKN